MERSVAQGLGAGVPREADSLFPAAEGYGSVNDGAGVIIFRQAPLPIAASDAPGGARRRIRTIFTDDDGSGFFPRA